MYTAIIVFVCGTGGEMQGLLSKVFALPPSYILSP